jgi:hypothetical protein
LLSPGHAAPEGFVEAKETFDATRSPRTNIAALAPASTAMVAKTGREPVTCGTGGVSCPHFLSGWAGLGVLGLYAAVALTAGGWLVAKRDA